MENTTSFVERLGAELPLRMSASDFYWNEAQHYALRQMESARTAMTIRRAAAAESGKDGVDLDKLLERHYERNLAIAEEQMFCRFASMYATMAQTALLMEGSRGRRYPISNKLGWAANKQGQGS